MRLRLEWSYQLNLIRHAIVIFSILLSPLYPVYFQAVIRFPEFFNVSFDQDIPLKPETESVYSRRGMLTEKCTRQLRGW